VSQICCAPPPAEREQPERTTYRLASGHRARHLWSGVRRPRALLAVADLRCECSSAHRIQRAGADVAV